MREFEITVPATQAPVRLDTFISRSVPACPRSQAAAMISKGRILVNDTLKKPGYKIHAGDVISGTISGTKPVRIDPQPIRLDILFEDEHLLVINKAAGMVVHPAAGNKGGTLVHALVFHVPELLHIFKGSPRTGIVHRLDKNTSGVMVVAKTMQALEFLQREFKQRRVEKRYLAIASGLLKETSGRIELPVGRHPVKRKQMAVNIETGKRAVSNWQVIRKLKDRATLVDVSLETGRTHQIRVHFYAIGYPLIGDPIYQFRRYRKKNTTARQMLHSARLSFRHPYSGRRMTFEASLPDDFNQMITNLEK